MALCNELWPWSVTNYPGKTRMLAYITGRERGTAGHWSKGTYLPGEPSCVRLVAWIRAKASRLEAIADEIERSVASRPKVGHGGFKKKRAVSDMTGVTGLLACPDKAEMPVLAEGPVLERAGIDPRPMGGNQLAVRLEQTVQHQVSGLRPRLAVPALPPKG
jgi:hypothetical protein